MNVKGEKQSIEKVQLENTTLVFLISRGEVEKRRPSKVVGEEMTSPRRSTSLLTKQLVRVSGLVDHLSCVLGTINLSPDVVVLVDGTTLNDTVPPLIFYKTIVYFVVKKNIYCDGFSDSLLDTFSILT